MNGKFMSTFDTQGIMGAYATSTAKCVCISTVRRRARHSYA